tara:strand:- start:262 stop:1338 length:1077 start_codon:yes stop_codon:yes gene_type:complete
MKIFLISGHEGSLSWRETMNSLSNKCNDFYYLEGLKDKNYRKIGFQRLFNRIYVFLIYPLKVLISLGKIKDFDFVFIVPSPFFIPLIVSFFIKHEKIVIIQTDIYPEGFSEIPLLKNFTIFNKFYRQISDYFYSKCKNFFISETLKNLRNYPESYVIYTPSISRLNLKSRSNHGNSIGYLGTLGHHHFGMGLVEMLKDSKFEVPIKFSFNVSGAFAKKFRTKVLKIEKKENLRDIEINGFLNEKEFQKKMESLDFGLVTMGENASKVLFPSKIPGHLACGHPLILISDQKNEAHEFIVNNDIGLSINLNDMNLNKLNTFILSIDYEKMSERALRVFQNNFNYETVADNFYKVLKSKDD